MKTYRLILDSPTDDITYVNELFTGAEAERDQRMTDQWNRFAAHKPGRGFRHRAREVLAPATDRRREKLSRIVSEICG